MFAVKVVGGHISGPLTYEVTSTAGFLTRDAAEEFARQAREAVTQGRVRAITLCANDTHLEDQDVELDLALMDLEALRAAVSQVADRLEDADPGEPGYVEYHMLVDALALVGGK